MARDIQVFIIEDDPYARDLMALLLTRDWRTHLLGSLEHGRRLLPSLERGDHGADVLILDTEIPGEDLDSISLLERIRTSPDPPRVLFTATRARHEIYRQMSWSGGGYILKGEILYSLASAVALVARGNTVITPGVLQVVRRGDLPPGCRVLDGRSSVIPFTQREREVMRLAIIFNLAQRDIADELVISRGWVSEMVSGIYEKLGVREILSRETPLETVIRDEGVLERLQTIQKRSASGGRGGRYRKAPWMATLAFHLLTVPESEPA